MHGSLLIVITAFHYRMKELLRGWYSQKIDVEVQIETFSAGVFASWFQSVGDIVGLEFQQLLIVLH